MYTNMFVRLMSELIILFVIPKERKPSVIYRGADKSLARTGRKKATATEDFDFHISYL
jgi:hypothetical protein